MEKMYKTKQQHSGPTVNNAHEGTHSKTNRTVHRIHKTFLGRMMEVHEETVHETVLVVIRRNFGKMGDLQ